MSDTLRVEKLSEGGEGEAFQIVFVDVENGGRHGYVTNARGSFSVAEVTEFFERCGQPAGDVLEMVRVARRQFAKTQAPDERAPLCQVCSRLTIFVRSVEHDVFDSASGETRPRLVAKVYRCAEHGLVEIPQRRRGDRATD
jgi:hypothetical protein